MTLRTLWLLPHLSCRLLLLKLRLRILLNWDILYCCTMNMPLKFDLFPSLFIILFFGLQQVLSLDPLISILLVIVRYNLGSDRWFFRLVRFTLELRGLLQLLSPRDVIAAIFANYLLEVQAVSCVFYQFVS
jgi:hypothetical protein